jgi:hypothetical protein
VAALAVGGGGGDGGESAKKDEPPAAAPAAEGTTTATMSDVKMATDEDGKHPAEVFSPNDTFYCVGYLKNAPEDTKVTAVWLAADVEGVKPDTKIKQISAEGGTGLFRFNLTSTNGSWPTGKYGVELYLNDAKKPAKALAFEVR